MFPVWSGSGGVRAMIIEIEGWIYRHLFIDYPLNDELKLQRETCSNQRLFKDELLRN